MINTNIRGIVKSAPNGVIVICGTVLAVAVLAAYVFLANTGKDAAEISRFVNTLLNFAMLVIGSVGAVAAGAAAKTSGEAKDLAQTAVKQTNGDLDARIQAGVTAALAQQRQDDQVGDVNPDQGTLI